MNYYFLYSVTFLAESESAGLFMSVAWSAILLAGVSFFLFGILLGWRIWGAYRGRAKRIEKETAVASHNLEDREASFKNHQEKYGKKNTESEAGASEEQENQVI